MNWVWLGLAGVISATCLWMMLDDDPPKTVRTAGWTFFFAFVLLANAGIGGLLGVGSPFVVPLLWLAAKRAGPWLNAICIALAGLSGTLTGLWLGWYLDLETDPILTPIATGCLTVTMFVRFTTQRAEQ